MASINLSPELVWKLHSEVASIYERVGHVEMARKSLVLSERHAPENLIWKVWLHGARVELACGSIAAGRRLLVRSLCAVPKRMSSQVLLEFAHFEEVLGNLDKARYILSKAKKDTDNEWKVLLESVLLEMRCQELDRAITSAREALRLHPSTGRLWAILIQLEHIKTYSSPSYVATIDFRELLRSYRWLALQRWLRVGCVPRSFKRSSQVR
jgi:tetratricopeptide (TPR) repeat protein